MRFIGSAAHVRSHFANSQTNLSGSFGALLLAAAMPVHARNSS